MSSLVIFVSQDSQFARMLNDTVITSENVILLSFNLVEECVPFCEEQPKFILIHLNHCDEITDKMKDTLKRCKEVSPRTKIEFILPVIDDFYEIEEVINSSNVIFKNGDLFNNLRNLILS